VFLRLMTMDDDGMLRRKNARVPSTEVYARVGPSDRKRYFKPGSSEDKAVYREDVSQEDLAALQTRAFLSMAYDEKMGYCTRPEEIDGPSPASWKVINRHLNTSASTLPQLVVELGRRRFGHVPIIGDAFVGGGSLPFEAVRLGCHSYGSDLSPVATLLSWASVNILAGGNLAAAEANTALKEAFAAVNRQVCEWGIEHREPDLKTGRRWRADAYLYCVEVTCPECGWRVPLAPSWAVGKTSMAVVRLVPDTRRKRYDFEVEHGVSEKILKEAEVGTARDAKLHCPHCHKATPIKVIRGDGRGTFGDTKNCLRPWTQQDVQPLLTDVFGERLYCIRWVDEWTDRKGKKHRVRRFMAPTAADLEREAKVLELLLGRLENWQATGVVPRRRIESGAKTDEPIRTRGWTHWHHLFNPRQLLLNGLLSETAFGWSGSEVQRVALLLAVGRCADWNSRLCRWGTGAARESIAQTFSNQALNTLVNYASKGLLLLEGSWDVPTEPSDAAGSAVIEVRDAREVGTLADVWITDPPYADAIRYDELSEFFLAWYEGSLSRVFPTWPTDSRRALAVRGEDESFHRSMVASYAQLAKMMPNNGLQVVMFTHQDPSVWADLATILWAAGLRVTAAWCIQTEREATGTREGNYVQGTVLLLLRKPEHLESAFMDEVYQDVEFEVKKQLDSMLALDDARDPSFGDTDYQLAAYAAALRVLTSKKIEDLDISYELSKHQDGGSATPVETLIRQAVRIACDHLVPRGLEPHLWKSLTGEERFYLKGLEMESHGEYRNGVYQELARGFGLEGYGSLLASTKANETRVRTATEFGRKELDDSGFGATPLRHALFATWKTADTDSTADGLAWLKTECPAYATARERLIQILEFVAAFRENASMPHWYKDATAASWLAGALRNRQDNV
jgi:adenine-specific DNA methylase